MRVEKTANEQECFDISFTTENKKFLMNFGGDGDLYWSIFKADDLPSQEISFEITKENYFLYERFLELYNGIEECKVFEVIPLELELCDSVDERERLCERVARSNSLLKRDRAYSLLFSNGVICWHSDEDNYDAASVVEIRKNEESFSLVFKPGLHEDEANSVSIRFRNSGSTYKPFNILFMRMYNALNDYNFDCYQMHIEESLYRQKVKRKDN